MKTVNPILLGLFKGTTPPTPHPLYVQIYLRFGTIYWPNLFGVNLSIEYVKCPKGFMNSLWGDLNQLYSILFVEFFDF